MSCRMYEKKLPDVGDLVMVKVEECGEFFWEVSLVEYNNIPGALIFNELSLQAIKKLSKGKIGKQQIVYVRRVDTEKGNYCLFLFFY